MQTGSRCAPLVAGVLEVPLEAALKVLWVLWVLWVLCVALLLTGGCKLPDEVGCAEGAACPAGQRCLLVEDEASGVCAPICQRSSDCSESTPLCDDRAAVCRSCFPGEDALCAARSPAAPRCDGGRCVACRPPRGEASQSPECQSRASAAPVCERAGARCRPCQRHSECDSGVCVKDEGAADVGLPAGSCVPSAQVLVVDPSLCSGLGPVFCTAAQALARVDATHRFVLLRRSAAPADFSDLTLGNLPTQQGLSVHLVGPLADQPPHRVDMTPSVALGGVPGRDTLSIQHARVTLEGLYFLGGRSAVLCSGADAGLRVVRSFFAGNETALSVSAGCALSLEESWLGRGPDGGGYQGVMPNARAVEVNGSDFRIVNSVLTDNGDYRRDAFGGVRIRALGPDPGKRSLILNSTLYQQSGLQKAGKYFTAILCDAPLTDRLVLMNTLFLGDKPLILAPEEHYVDPGCGAVLRRVGSNDPLLRDGDSVVLQMTATPLVNAPARDLRPSLRSPDGVALQQGGAARTEVAGQSFTAPLLDLAGQARPTDRVTIGAFEPGP